MRVDQWLVESPVSDEHRVLIGPGWCLPIEGPMPGHRRRRLGDLAAALLLIGATMATLALGAWAVVAQALT